MAVNREKTATVGYFAIQLAKLHGIEVATTCSPRNYNKVRQAAASHVFDYKDKHIIPRLRQHYRTSGMFLTQLEMTITAVKAMCSLDGVLCTFRPGKTHTQNIPSHIKVADVFVLKAFPTAHTYRGKVHWLVSIASINLRTCVSRRSEGSLRKNYFIFQITMGDHRLSTEFHGRLESMLSDGSLKPPVIRDIGQVSPSAVQEAMELNRQGHISGEKLVLKCPY
ncbi:hypothetical protein QQS21_003582 [Conoideocrella luteorostrata]|uniref:Uncharacterized protein n=1 Tax=Conoideocrella luteorostrata TaxID=1105319 RepID=A0AAJ0G0I6_9HYPO|nr:hypothetical protein QQS21_003582 [Conoideocrella luteorostrata]